MNNIINETQKYLYDYLCNSEHDENEIDYRFEHSLRVANIGLQLAEAENANKKVVVLGCLLHDIGKFDTKINKDHGRISAKIAEQFLKKFDLSNKEIADICYSIATHVDGEAGYEYEEILESKIVTDADNIDRFSSSKIRQSKIWELNWEKESINEKITVIEEKILKFKKYLEVDALMTKSGSDLFRKKLELQLHFNTELLKDMRLTKTPIYNIQGSIEEDDKWFY